VKLGGRSIYVLHNLKELGLDPTAAGIDVVVSGHSHRPKIETVGRVQRYCADVFQPLVDATEHLCDLSRSP
jgi:predicted phosphodiesterase